LDVTAVVQLLSLIVARDVLVDAGAPGSAWYDSERTGVILGMAGPTTMAHPLAARLETPVLREVVRAAGLDEAETAAVSEAFSLAFPPWEENSFPGLLGNVVSGRITNRLDLGGTNYTVDSACASGLTAVRGAIAELIDHRADLMITGGCDTENSIFSYMCFSKTQALSKSDRIQPFAAGADGTLVGEGIGMLALKRLADAERDGDRIYAVIRGLGSSSDGRFKSVYAPRAEGQVRALRRAYADAGVSPASVELFEAHATGTAVGDATELSALGAVLAEAGARPGRAAIGSVKSQIGHTKGAAGAASLIKLSLSLYNRVLPPTINVREPNPALAQEGSPFYLSTRTRPWVLDPDVGRRRAAASAMGFGGTNFHVVLEETPDTARPDADKRAARATHRAVRAHLWHAATPAELLDLVRGQAEPNGDTGIPGSAARVGFVARTGAEAERLRAIAIEQLAARADAAEWSHPAGVHYRRQAAEQPRVGVVFAGQGSQYVDMGLTAAVEIPPVREAFDAANATFAGAELTLARAVFPPPSFDPGDRADHEMNLTRTEYAQPAIGALSVGQFRFLRELGLRPVSLLGHSFGELTALWAAGSLADADFFRLARRRGQAMAPPDEPGFDPGTMAAVRADRDAVAELLTAHPDVVVCNHNAPDQVVVGGPTPAVEEFVTAATANGLDARRISVAAAFHTSLVGHAVDDFAAAVDVTEIGSPAVPVHANTAGARYGDDPAENRRVLTRQLGNPVEFVAGLQALHADGATVVVEIGPSQVLTGLVRRTLGDDVVAIPTDAGRDGDGAVALMTAAVRLAVLGVELSGLNRYTAPLPQQVQPTGMTVALTGADYVSEPRRRAYADALVTLAAAAAVRPRESAAAALENVPTATERRVPEAAPAPTRPVPTQPAPAPTRPVPTQPAPAPTRPVPTQPAPAPTRAVPVPTAIAPVAPAPAAATLAAPAPSAGEVAGISEVARDHLALHSQFLDTQLRVAEGLVQVLRAAPADNGAGQEIRAAADAVTRQSLAVGEAHIRVNEILASLTDLEYGNGVGGQGNGVGGHGVGGHGAGGLAAGGAPGGALTTGTEPTDLYGRGTAGDLRTPGIPAPGLPAVPLPIPSTGNSNGRPAGAIAAAPPVPPVTVPSVPSVPSVPPVTVPSAAPATVGSQPATAGIAQPATAEPPAGVDVSVIESAVAEVVAEKTGYPVDVLEPSMALESDL
ncbi:acyltransferase domain-containing protein, partial [Frankia casuarinae]|uniref:acyltransferase domain-containing protein n=2 Tax=Frankia TaxID=1854 RepID=UPI0036F24364